MGKTPPSPETLIQRVRDLEGQVSKLQEAGEALKKSEERYRLLIESSTEMILFCDTDWTIRYANREAFKLSGYTGEEVLGQSIGRFLDRKEFQSIKRRIESASTFEGPRALCETAFIHRDGHTIPIEVISSLIVDQGRPKGFLFNARDISERKAIETELQKANKLESIGVLAGGIAHDYNNLLTALMGYMTLAESLLSSEKEALAYLGRARHAAIMAKNLSRKLITFSKGGKPLKRPGPLPPTLENSVSFALAGSNIECEFHIPSTLWSAEFDESQISQVVHNIIMNAREAMPRGGTIRVRAENRHIRERNGHTVDPGDWVKVTIEDEGIGIPKEHLDKIFDPYFSTKEMGPQKGLGLGLAIAHSVIRNHQGFLFAESDPHRGTTLSFYLPAAGQHSDGQAAPRPASGWNGETRILVMDDEETVRDITAKMLEKFGYKVTMARDGDEAVRLFRHERDKGHPFHAAILDLTVRGGMGGKEAVEKLLELDPDLKAIVSSGYSDDPVMTGYRAYGFCAAVTKPYSMNDLKETLSAALGRKETASSPPHHEPPALQVGRDVARA